jgi:hypothetical protein
MDLSGAPKPNKLMPTPPNQILSHFIIFAFIDLSLLAYKLFEGWNLI